MTDLWSIHTVDGPNLGADELSGVLDVHHSRIVGLWESLSADEWSRPSRNRAWTVHETARHATDALQVGVAHVTDAPMPFSMDGFDPNHTPAEWLALSNDESPAQTIDRYRGAVGQARRGVAERLATGDNALLRAPYGEAHWATLVVHLLWDSWLHERDIAFPIGKKAPATPSELRLVGLYAVLMTLVPLRGAESVVDRHLHLGGDIDVTIRATTTGNDIEVGEIEEPCDVGGDAAAMIDSLSGRGTPIVELAPGFPEEMAFFAAYLSS